MKQFFESLLEEIEGIYLCYHRSTTRQKSQSTDTPSLPFSLGEHPQAKLLTSPH